ncbi:hypothetical protein T439DRAFT_358808 [Meredithblackwellia eburnea MCA 4105]
MEQNNLLQLYQTPDHPESCHEEAGFPSSVLSKLEQNINIIFEALIRLDDSTRTLSEVLEYRASNPSIACRDYLRDLRQALVVWVDGFTNVFEDRVPRWKASPWISIRDWVRGYSLDTSLLPAIARGDPAAEFTEWAAFFLSLGAARGNLDCLTNCLGFERAGWMPFTARRLLGEPDRDGWKIQDLREGLSDDTTQEDPVDIEAELIAIRTSLRTLLFASTEITDCFEEIALNLAGMFGTGQGTKFSALKEIFEPLDRIRDSPSFNTCSMPIWRAWTVKGPPIFRNKPKDEPFKLVRTTEFSLPSEAEPLVEATSDFDTNSDRKEFDSDSVPELDLILSDDWLSETSEASSADSDEWCLPPPSATSWWSLALLASVAFGGGLGVGSILRGWGGI